MQDGKAAVAGWVGCSAGGPTPTQNLEESDTRHTEGVWFVGVSSWSYNGNKTPQVKGTVIITVCSTHITKCF